MAEQFGPAGLLFVSGEYPPDIGGLADYTARLRAALRERGVDSAVLTGARPATPELGVHRLDRSWNIGALQTLARLAPSDGIVHIQYQPGAYGLRGEICLAPLALRALRRDARVVTTFHDVRVPYLFPKAGRLRPAAVRLLARTSQAVLAADPRDLAWLGCPPRRSFQVPIGPNVEPNPPDGYDRAGFRAKLGLGPDNLAVAYFGFLNASKGLETLLAAFENVARRAPTARLLVLGGAVGASDPTDRATAERFAARLGPLAERVTRPGYLPAHELSAYLLAADVALLPYEDGASPRRGSLLACAAHDLPIVTTTGPGLIPPLDGNLLAHPPGDAAALADAVLGVAQGTDLRERLRAGAARIAAAASWAAIADTHLAIYANLYSRPC